ncbi:TPA: hypothetical protein DCR49_12340 [Candidatus Delongbacteria bacterium]|nr:hypothetical protein [Candidatus Delongbacteria bacterium]
MNKKNKTFKIVSILTLLMFLNSCTLMSLKEIPKEEIKDQTKAESVFIIVHKSIKYRLSNPLMNGGISGDIELQSSELQGAEKFNQVFIYLSDDYELQGSKIIVPIGSVTKVEIYKLDGIKAVIFAGGVILIVVGLIYAFFNSDMKMNSGLNL